MKNNTKIAGADVNVGLGHISLARMFAPVDRDKTIPLDLPPVWGRKLYGWLTWPELLARQRVVLLAEAGSGKTAEFQMQAARLRASGAFAVFVPVEQLADIGLEEQLDPAVARSFATWKSTGEPGYFFLDAVDEARLNRQSFDTALIRLSRALDGVLGRAHIFVSCRISDWRGRQDYDAVLRCLPLGVPTSPMPSDPETELLSPIFERETYRQPKTRAEPPAPDVTIVRLGALSGDDRRALALGMGVVEIEPFMAAIEQNGLGTLADRPSDLIELAMYWRAHRRFGTLTQMHEHAVMLKLRERDAFRPDNGVLSPEKARSGAERIAAAMTLGCAMTLKAAGQEADPSLATGSVDASDVLPEWTDEERNALLRRPVFAPATYGRIRFHHRGTQEYLTASWFHRLLAQKRQRGRLLRLLLAERYGVATVVPALRAVAAWLAPKHPDILKEIIAREPITLLQYGDPGELSLPARRALLARLAERHRDGDVYDDRLDDRGIWLFATPALAGAIEQAWQINRRDEFRTNLLRMVREGKVAACRGLWRQVLEDPTASGWLCVAAVEAAEACGDAVALKSFASAMGARASELKEEIAAQLAARLFPRFLDVATMIEVMQACIPVSRTSVGGFARQIDALSAACRTTEERLDLVGRIVDLVLLPPHDDDETRVSRRFGKFTETLVPVVRQLVEQWPADAVPVTIVRALLAIERCDHYHRHEGLPALIEAVGARPAIKQALLWAGVDEIEVVTGQRPVHAFERHRFGTVHWPMNAHDLGWLLEDLKARLSLGDRRIVLDLAAGVLVRAGELQQRAGDLSRAIGDEPELRVELAKWLSPPTAALERRIRREDAVWKKRHDAEEAEAKESWRRFRRDLQCDPMRISDPDLLAKGQFGALWDLTRWLRARTGQDAEEIACLGWRMLEPVFGANVAAAYKAGMLTLWRVCKPLWPKHTGDHGLTTYHVTELAFAGVALEAAEDPQWVSRLSGPEAIRAAELACKCEKNYPTWLDDLIASRSDQTLPVLRRCLRAEWADVISRHQTLLYHWAHSDQIAEAVRSIIADVLLRRDAARPVTAELGVRVLTRLADTVDRRRVARVAADRLRHAVEAGDGAGVPIAVALLMLVDAKAAVEGLRQWIDAAPVAARKDRSEAALARLFGRDRSLAVGTLSAIPATVLGELCRLGYVEISPLADLQHEGSYTPGVRDDAQSARNAILSALIERTGREAFDEFSAIGQSGIAGIHPRRFRELAHHMAERASGLRPWQPADVRALEQHLLTPIQTGEQLLDTVHDVLDDISELFADADAAPHRLMSRALTEEEVQEWLASELKVRAQGRYHAHREPPVAGKKRPDIVASATTCADQVAIEIKHANKGWTLRELERALISQLVGQYLRPAERRHGALVITLHKARTWRDPATHATLTFEQVIDRLRGLAAGLVRNATGDVSVRVIGLNFTAKAPTAQALVNRVGRGRRRATRRGTSRPGRAR